MIWWKPGVEAGCCSWSTSMTRRKTAQPMGQTTEKSWNHLNFGQKSIDFYIPPDNGLLAQPPGQQTLLRFGSFCPSPSWRWTSSLVNRSTRTGMHLLCKEVALLSAHSAWGVSWQTERQIGLNNYNIHFRMKKYLTIDVMNNFLLGQLQRHILVHRTLKLQIMSIWILFILSELSCLCSLVWPEINELWH